VQAIAIRSPHGDDSSLTRHPLEQLSPLSGDETRQAALLIAAQLRDLILAGGLPPGIILSQAQLADRFGVSRTPVREALRMLHATGLVAGEINKRMRVVGFTPQLVDGTYAERIAIEAISVSISTQHSSAEDVAELDQLLVEMDRPEAHVDFECWRGPHLAFHELLVRRAPPHLCNKTHELQERTQRFRVLIQERLRPGWWRRGELEHGRIAEEFRRRNAEGVAVEITRHLARSALELLTEFSPSYEPVGVRSVSRLLERNAEPSVYNQFMTKAISP